MLYTSYFAKLKILTHEGITPVAICGKSPEWYNGFEYKKLAPKWGFFSEWKKNHDNHFYVRCFNEQVLDKLDINGVITDLNELTHWSKDIALLCYERPEDFCHRHLVANWLRENGLQVKEFGT